jgi:hypothetical protein
MVLVHHFFLCFQLPFHSYLSVLFFVIDSAEYYTILLLFLRKSNSYIYKFLFYLLNLINFSTYTLFLLLLLLLYFLIIFHSSESK